MKFSLIYGTAWKKEQTQDLVSQALEKGFVAIDTANQPKHYNEPQVGEALKIFFKKGHRREDFFIQTKFTPIDGQDHRVPYDRNASITDQVSQSLQLSLKQLHVDYLDSYLLHGPYHQPRLGEEDWEVWSALEKAYDSGKVGSIGVSNFNPLQLAELIEKSRIKPSVVQNRCFAQTGWDAQVRYLCRDNQIMYQGFSLLTANPFVLEFPSVLEMAQRREVTPAQIVFAFARQVGMVPLTGTSDPIHMAHDLASDKIILDPAELKFLSANTKRQKGQKVRLYFW
jgi:diketogulonate reductase-like aldo/keto reductase